MAATATQPGDAGKYPIILSDALLGRGSKDVYTSIRYNHKPNPSPGANESLLTPASTSDDSRYQLKYNNKDKGKEEEFTYEGTRQPGENKYVLVFDPAREAYILHSVDSSFDMNITSTPWEQDASALRNIYPQIGPITQPSQLSQSSQPFSSQPTSEPSPVKPKPAAKVKAAPKAKPAKQTKASTKASAAKEKPKPASPKRRAPAKTKKPKAPVRRSPTPSEADDSDSDDGLTIEYPDAKPPASTSYRPRSPVVPAHRAPHSEDEMSVDGESDADGEEDAEHDRDVDMLELPAPANGASGGFEDDLDNDLEAQLEEAFDTYAAPAVHVTRDDESSESEEE